MKKVILFAVAVATLLSVTACGSNRSKQIDSLSYAIGVDLGMNLRFGMEDLDLDRDVIVANLKDFYKNGNLEGEEVQQLRNDMMQYQFTVLMPFMNSKRMREMSGSDQPDTLPALPPVFNEEFTRERVSTMIGKNFGAAVKSVEAEIVLKDILGAMNDALELESPELADSLLRMNTQQINQTFANHAKRMQEKAAAEFEKAKEENAAASAKWLEEVEAQKGVVKTASGLLYRIDREGNDVFATEDSDVVKVDYEGKTRTGEVFDSSYERGEPIAFALNRVISGWTEGMKLVGEGGQITLWIPSELAYKERGSAPKIGPNEALEFKVELHKVNPEE